MNYGKDPRATLELAKQFKKFATKKHGVNSMYYDKIVGSMTPYLPWTFCPV
jgi:ATP-dependent Clp protease protease subunit